MFIKKITDVFLSIYYHIFILRYNVFYNLSKEQKGILFVLLLVVFVSLLTDPTNLIYGFIGFSVGMFLGKNI